MTFKQTMRAMREAGWNDNSASSTSYAHNDPNALVTLPPMTCTSG